MMKDLISYNSSNGLLGGITCLTRLVKGKKTKENFRTPNALDSYRESGARKRIGRLLLAHSDEGAMGKAEKENELGAM